jgi:hypothetical protein
MDFLNYREGRLVFYQVFLLSPLLCTVQQLISRNCKRLREFGTEIEAVEGTVNSKKENSSAFCLDFVREFDLWIRTHQKASLDLDQNSDPVNQNPYTGFTYLFDTP